MFSSPERQHMWYMCVYPSFLIAKLLTRGEGGRLWKKSKAAIPVAMFSFLYWSKIKSISLLQQAKQRDILKVLVNIRLAEGREKNGLVTTEYSYLVKREI